MKRLLIITTCLGVLAALMRQQLVTAADIGTVVIVGNIPPIVSVGPAEDASSSASNPTNATGTITFKATATEPNDATYYLAICKTPSITANSDLPPTCNGGNWCMSGATASGVPAFCNYTTLSNDGEINDWYAFVCDSNSTTPTCSELLTTSGDSGSPFVVNHAPNFTGISNSGATDPGLPVTWTTAPGTADQDLIRGVDQVKLIVCKTPGITPGGACSGGSNATWCTSNFANATPTCSTTLPLPFAPGTYNAYTYVIDDQNMAAISSFQGSNSAFQVNNLAPTISNININARTV